MTPAASSPGAVPVAVEVPLLNRLAPPATVRCIAVLHDPATGAASHPWDAARVREQVALLMTDAQVKFEYFPVRFAGSDAAAAIADAFTRIAAQTGATAPDLVLVVGGPAVVADISVIHQALAPCILAAPVPVFTALGADDAETILGDTACSVFPGVHAMLEAVTALTPAGRAPVEQLRQRIQSLARFLLAQQDAESKILLQAMLLPALRRQLERQMQQARRSGAQIHATAQRVKLRLARDEAGLEQARARIAIELARLAQQQVSARLDAAGVVRMRHLRIGMLCGLLCLIAVLWWSMAPASAVFFSGCALVVGSALYVALSNRIIDSNAVASASRSGAREPSALPANRPKPVQERLFQPAAMPAENIARREPHTRTDRGASP